MVYENFAKKNYNLKILRASHYIERFSIIEVVLKPGVKGIILTMPPFETTSFAPTILFKS